MIVSLQGTLARKTPTEIVVDVHGVGYGVLIPLTTFEALGAEGATVTLFTHLHVREDVMQLYGFATEEERAMFRLLLSVSGIGPRSAQGILSGLRVSELRTHLAEGNAAALTRVPGIGRKTAERLIVELRERLGKDSGDPAAGRHTGPGGVRIEAILALTSLGYSRPVAEKAVLAAMKEQGDGAHELEGLLKLALRHTG
jgi:Holliday junction DNA helicase RuvA